ncbi:MAG: phage terminase large subunit family protein [Holophagales bacterium]|jgi:phage terminase large subunit GpA-like protein|nr:phage terminase large subunit family protein [Holophagales bacterium]
MPTGQNLSPAAQRLISSFLQAFAPPKDMTASEWADEYFYLSAESAAIPGKWHTLPYQRAILDAITDPTIEEVWVKKSARMGFTKMLDIAIAYHIHQEPCPILFVQPTIEDAQSTSKEEIDPMLRDVPVLAALLSNSHSTGAKVKDNTLLHKTFSGPNGRSLLSLIGANSPRGFRRVSRRIILFDEVDAYPLSAGAEGDQIALGKKRGEYYMNRKIVGGSTPTIKNLSRIETELEDTNKQKRYLPCPFCNHFQTLEWGGPDVEYGIKWESGKPETAKYMCEACHQLIDHSQLRWMDERGEWRPTAKGNPKKAGFIIWAAYSYSPNSTWASLAAEWLEAKDSPEKKVTFINTVRGESYEAEGEQADPKDLEKRLCKTWKPYEVPPEVVLLVQVADVQGNRLECQTIGFGSGERAWLIDHEVIPGSPKDAAVWELLDEWRRLPRIHQKTGKAMAVEICLIDSNFETDSVVKYVRPRYSQRVFACRGEEKLAVKALVAKGSTRKERTLQYRVATWDIKAILQHRLAIGDDRPGRIYLPEWVSNSYLQQITSERLIRQRDRKTGRVTLTWVKTQDRNEALDLWVYAIAALRVLQEFHGRRKYSDLDKLHKQRIVQATPPPEPPPPEPKKTRVSRRPQLPPHRQ